MILINWGGTWQWRRLLLGALRGIRSNYGRNMECIARNNMEVLLVLCRVNLCNVQNIIIMYTICQVWFVKYRLHLHYVGYVFVRMNVHYNSVWRKMRRHSRFVLLIRQFTSFSCLEITICCPDYILGSIQFVYKL